MPNAENDAIDALLLPHSIGAVDNPRQGIAQTLPVPVVLCLSCGWMRVDEYHAHLVDRLAEWLDGVLGADDA